MNLVQRFPKNELGKDYIVGDIHGAFFKLRDALESIQFDPSVDRLFSVGDLIDRGSECEKVVEWLSYPWFHAVKGNHEDMLEGFAKCTWPRDNYIDNGGGWFLDLPDSVQKQVLNSIRTLPYMIEIETSEGYVGIIHANTRGDDWAYMLRNIELQHVKYHGMWSRDRIWGAKFMINDTPMYREFKGDNVKHIRAVVVGHSPLKKVVKIGNVYHIDTMGWSKGSFTFMNAETLEILKT